MNRMIINTVHLANGIKDADPTLPVEFTPGDNNVVLVNGTSVGGLCDGNHSQRPFEPITITRGHALQLVRVLEQLNEQPITLFWNGSHFVIKDASI